MEGVIALVPPERRALARIILYDLKYTLHAWVVGQLIAMSVLAVLTTLGLWLLDVPYFLAFGVFAGIAAIVPFFGTLFSTLIPGALRPRRGGSGKGHGRHCARHWSTPDRGQLRGPRRHGAPGELAAGDHHCRRAADRKLFGLGG